MAADRNCILTAFKVASQKVLMDESEIGLFGRKALSKRWTVRIFRPLSLRIAL